MNNETASLHVELDRIKNELIMAQCAKQEMKMENEWKLEEMRIKHGRAVDALRAECDRRVQQAENRAIAAEMGIYKLKSKVELAALQRSLREVEENRESLIKIVTKMHQFASTAQERADVEAFSTALEQWTNVRDCLQQIIENTKSQYEAIIELIQSGTPLATLHPVVIPERPPAPSIPTLPSWMKQRLLAQDVASSTVSSTTSTQHSRIPPVQQLSPPPGLEHISQLSQLPTNSNLPRLHPDPSLSATSLTNNKLSAATSPLKSNNNLPCTVGKVEKLYEEVEKRMGNVDRAEIKAAMIIAKRGQPNGSFKGVHYGRVVELIIDKLMESRAATAALPPSVATTQPTPSSQSSSAAQKLSSTTAIKDDVCSICNNALVIGDSELLRCATCNIQSQQ